MAGAFLLDDLSAMFDVDEFAITATVGAVSMPVIFDRPYDAALGGMVDASLPMCQVRDADVAATGLDSGDTLVIASTTWRVNSVQPDGTGVTRLILELAS